MCDHNVEIKLTSSEFIDAEVAFILNSIGKITVSCDECETVTNQICTNAIIWKTRSITD